uniref:Uncharacterized protein n=1 Tax=Arundo donax TaxID=35708 RepID=A0A0A9C3A5_ARUDO
MTKTKTDATPTNLLVQPSITICSTLWSNLLDVEK